MLHSCCPLSSLLIGFGWCHTRPLPIVKNGCSCRETAMTRKITSSVKTAHLHSWMCFRKLLQFVCDVNTLFNHASVSHHAAMALQIFAFALSVFACIDCSALCSVVLTCQIVMDLGWSRCVATELANRPSEGGPWSYWSTAATSWNPLKILW